MHEISQLKAFIRSVSGKPFPRVGNVSVVKRSQLLQFALLRCDRCGQMITKLEII
ncbi:hypothetical protein I8748_06395 [Nostoc sp. CENA67]|uniref:Uncharacterized protein n=1 Tax=Amazonocrinis nigriterrae CENA67 TaxID=2794033 RepID=A0A8J7HM72_9NOST|nr:hypothetical protein [Amazonocrinis nigriterrae]MBH8561807.1 hypothetical protein [Amazonocrinis nigriterrae CENA67]